MATAGDGEAEIPLLSDVVPGTVDFRGRPSIRWKSGCWKSASFILGVAMAERVAYYGISSNMVSYLTGVLGQSTAAAAANLNAWYGTASLTPILGAFLADSFFGRYQMVVISSMAYILGLGFLSLSAALNSFSSSDCEGAADYMSCSPPLLWTAFFFFSLYLVALAHGGHNPCLQAFGADQFDVKNEKEYQAKSSFFNWNFWFASFGVLLAFLIVNYIQENLSWELGFGVPAIVMCFATLEFLVGTMTYRFHVNGHAKDSPFVGTSRIFAEGDRNCETAYVTMPQECPEFESVSVALLAPDASAEDEKVRSTATEKGKAIFKLAPIWCTCLGFSIICAQPSTLFTKQGVTLDRHITPSFELPAASLQIWISVSLMAFIPIYDCILIPIVKAATKNQFGISMLKRIGIGLCLSLISVVLAAVVESKRLATARKYGVVDMPEAVIPMSVWWLAPQYVLSGTADVFTSIGLQEFFYDQVPGDLKSIGVALYLSILGTGSFLSSFLVYVIDKGTRENGEGGWFSDNINRAHLDYFYWLLAGIGAASLACYTYYANSYVYGNRRNNV